MRLRPDSFASAAAPYAAGILCVLLGRSGFFAALFLTPIASVAFAGRKAVWTTAGVAVGFNVLVAGAETAFSGVAANALWLYDALYFAAAAIGIAYLAAPPAIGAERMLRAAFRLMLAAAFSAVAALPLYLAIRTDELLWSAVREQAGVLVEAFKASAGADVVQLSLLDDLLDADALIVYAEGVALRGAVLAGQAAFLFASWRIGLLFAGFRRPELRDGGRIRAFRINPGFVWALIGGGAALLAGLFFRIMPLEIAAWNVVALCWLTYAAQGYSILQHLIGRPGLPRLLAPLSSVLVLLLLLQNGINVVVSVAFAVVGVAENWLPLRAPYPTEPPSTPGA